MSEKSWSTKPPVEKEINWQGVHRWFNLIDRYGYTAKTNKYLLGVVSRTYRVNEKKLSIEFDKLVDVVFCECGEMFIPGEKTRSQAITHRYECEAESVRRSIAF